MSRRQPPVIIIGMHRSGTTLVAKTLEKLGLFVGWRKDVNNEALFFLHLNEWLLAQAGSRWDRPPAVGEWLGDDTFRELLGRTLRSALTNINAASYWGVSGILTRRQQFCAPFPWGWKDPRNTITLPLWLDLFPDARVIHIRRHGLDVAMSLVRRNREFATNYCTRGLARWRPFTRMKPLWFSPHCDRAEDAFDLWECYLQHAENHLAPLARQTFDLRFEDFLASPEVLTAKLAAFCGVSADSASVAEACFNLQTGRAFVYRTDSSLLELADRYRSRLAAHGY